MDISLKVLIYIGIVLLFVLIIASIYLVFALRRINIFFKKSDYLVEDLTYKSEMLNSGVETVANLQNYVDAWNVATKRNIKSIANLAFRNRNMAYYLINKIRDNVKDGSTKTKKNVSQKSSSIKTKKNVVKKSTPTTSSTKKTESEKNTKLTKNGNK